MYKDVIIVNLKDGLYLFLDSKKFSLYGFYKNCVTDFGTASSGELLVDFLDFDIRKVILLAKSVETLSSEETIMSIGDLGTDNCTMFLIKLMADNNWEQAYNLSSENSDEEYKRLVLKTLNSVVSIHSEVWELADYYCECYGSAEERFDIFHSLSEDFTMVVVDEIISSRKPGADFFADQNNNEYCFPYAHAYRFTNLKNYVQFIFMNMMQYNSNFCKCNYCYRFFIPKTKKLTRFCDRVNPESGKTCKEIAPSVFRNDDVDSNAIMKEYDRALRRNYKRMCRAEERLSERSSVKDIDPQTYFDWRDRVLKAMRLWKNKQISDEEFLKVVKEFD